MKKIIVLYDNWCPNCTNFINTIQKLDYFKLIDAKKLRNIDKNTYPNLNLELAKKQMACYNGKWNYGFQSICLIFSKLPIFWLITPLLLILKITRIGEYIYNELAVKRKIIPIHCNSKSCEI
ncbi:DCC1-like thiol-disulfide oxidoreductase family protein [Flavobacterium soli]|uniref:DCC1-like thiol-disulfide oxidoreductase family protein n=1 Tax=Flavobacterium soli TaxID=344881 RepID=UPI00047D6073|nr:DCC1-like thiol-disulfide oxidoreductase family protein [Flavobacterium soli]